MSVLTLTTRLNLLEATDVEYLPRNYSLGHLNMIKLKFCLYNCSKDEYLKKKMKTNIRSPQPKHTRFSKLKFEKKIKKKFARSPEFV